MNKYSQRIKVDVIDNQTGEIVSSSVDEMPVTTRGNDLEVGNNFKFSKLYHYSPTPFKKHVYNGYMYELIKHLEYNTNIILVKKRNTQEVATIDDIAKLLKISVRTIQPFFTLARKKIALVSVRIGHNIGYIINPAYALNGRTIRAMDFMLFKTSEDFINMLNRKQINALNQLIKEIDVEKYIKTNYSNRYKKLYKK